MQVVVKYNPYLLETDITIDGQPLNKQSKLTQFKNLRIQMWLEYLFPYLQAELNENSFQLIFHGTMADFSDVKEQLEIYLEGKENIQLEHQYVEGNDNKFELLKELIASVHTGPLRDEIGENIQSEFNRIMNDEFEIGIVATMSSGKSTLINAMLGEELMPSKNQACTATIMQIKNNDTAEGFSATVYDKEDNELQHVEHITSEALEAINDDKETAYVQVEGNIPNIYSGDLNLVLIDTPGPNNSMDKSHKDHTYRIIKRDIKPVVIYVMNATNLSTNDDKILLTTVAEQMKVGGKQSRDRFIFVVNKIDDLDPEREDLNELLQNVRNYLAEHGIDNPNIFPMSAELAKVIRMEKSGQKLTRPQRHTLYARDLFIEEPVMQMVQYAPLIPSSKKMLEEKIDEAKEAKDEKLETLYHSGVPSLEVAINEYLHKYALATKMNDVVNTLKEVIKEQNILQNLHKDTERHQEKREQLNKEIEYMKQEIEKGDKSAEFKKTIENIDFNQLEMTEAVSAKIQRRIRTITQELNDENINEDQANTVVENLKKDIENIQSDIHTDLEKVVEKTLQVKITEYIVEYKKYVEQLMDPNITALSVVNDLTFLTTYQLPDAERLLEDYIYETEEKTGKKKVKNPNVKWYKPWTWFKESYIEKDNFVKKDNVNRKKILEEIVQPFNVSLDENLNSASLFLQAEEKQLQRFLLNEFGKFEAILMEKISDLQKLSDKHDSIEENIKENEAKRAWLVEFEEKLYSILKIN